MEQNDKKDLSYLRVQADKKKIIHHRTLQKHTYWLFQLTDQTDTKV
jgi:hypothetical protein